MKIGYAAMLEQFSPVEAIALAARAESRGFDGTMATDHFQPWLPRHRASSHVWTVLGALGAHTAGDLGPGVTTPSFRVHPSVVAQASATLASMYPGRAWLGIGSGEALNEHVTGTYWPEARERIDRMFEAVEVIRRLFQASLSGKESSYRGDYFRLESSRLWTMPKTAPPIYIATAGPITARRAGKIADGLITTGSASDRLGPLLERFDEGVRASGRDPRAMKRVAQVHLSWAPTDEEAMNNAMTEWPIAGLRGRRADIRSPFDFEQFARAVTPEDMHSVMVVSSDLDVHRRELQRYADLGFDHIYVHNVGRNQEEWLDAFGRDVLPKVRS